MTDIKTIEERSKNMSAIKGKDTKPEVFLRKRLFAQGLRYRKNCPSVTGHPDIWLARFNTAIFVNGCFWHRHNKCKYAYSPKSNIKFWEDKFLKNKERDVRTIEQLNNQGIRCIIVWECTIRKMQKSAEVNNLVMEKILAFLNSDRYCGEL